MPKKKKQPEVETVAVAAPQAEVSEDLRNRYHAVYESSQQERFEQWGSRQDEANLVSNFLVAANRGTIAQSVIAAVETVPSAGVCWVCYEGPITIYIPFEEAFDEPPEELLEAEDSRKINRRKEQFLQKSIGVPVSFIITKVAKEGDAIVAVASRAKANAIIRLIHYGKDAERPLRPGDTVKAQIMGVGNAVMCLSIGGKDITVKNREMTHRYVDNMQTMWHAGDTIRVSVRAVEHGKKRGEVVSLSVTRREIEMEEAKAKLSRAKPGMKCIATVVSISADPFRINLWLDGLDIPAYAATRVFDRQQVRPGSKAMVRVIGKTDRDYIHCELVYAMPAGR